MKTPKQTKTSKATGALQRKLRRNYRVGRAKKRSVHDLQPNGHESPKEKPTKRTIRRGAYKLHERTIKALIRSIENACDAPIEMHCGIAGLCRDTYYEWRKKALAEPQSQYGRAMARVDKALHQAWRRLHEKAVNHKPTEVLFRRHSEHYPSDRMRVDVTSGDMPLLPPGQFKVILELADSQPENERRFEIT